MEVVELESERNETFTFISGAALVPGAMGRKGFETRAATTTYLGGDNLRRFSCEFIHEELDGAHTIG